MGTLLVIAVLTAIIIEYCSRPIKKCDKSCNNPYCFTCPPEEDEDDFWPSA